MRKEIYNCVQARWLQGLVQENIKLDEEELMNVFNFTNYDIVYSLFDPEPIRSLIIYPFKCTSITRIKPNQYATLSLYDQPSVQIKIDRPLIKNKLITLCSHNNPYEYAPGMLGSLEKAWANHVVWRSDKLFIDR